MRSLLVSIVLSTSAWSGNSGMITVEPFLLSPLKSSSTAMTLISLDGHWYASDNTAPFSLSFDGYSWIMPAAKMDLCRRADGQPQQYGGVGFYYGMYFLPVYKITSAKFRMLSMEPKISVLELKSASGNIVCEQEIAPPNLSIFKDGFERKDQIFISGFENKLTPVGERGVTINLDISNAPSGCKVISDFNGISMIGSTPPANLAMNGTFYNCGE